MINGRPLKSRNQWANKKVAEFREAIDEPGSWLYLMNQQPLTEEVRRLLYAYQNAQRPIDRIWNYRGRHINDYLHKASSVIIHYALLHKIDTILVGFNKTIYQNQNMGPRGNQNFSFIPLGKFKDMIVYKGEQVGIHVDVVSESWTSESSFADRDLIPDFGQEPNNFRVSGGRNRKKHLYTSRFGVRFNDDVHAAWNLIRKYYPHLITPVLRAKICSRLNTRLRFPGMVANVHVLPHAEGNCRTRRPPEQDRNGVLRQRRTYYYRPEAVSRAELMPDDNRHLICSKTVNRLSQ